jgi:hypothetical protein
MFNRGGDPKSSLRVGRYTIEHLRDVHKERNEIKQAKLKIDKRTKQYKDILEKERQNNIEQREIFAELVKQGFPKDDLLDIIIKYILMNATGDGLSRKEKPRKDFIRKK